VNPNERINHNQCRITISLSQPARKTTKRSIIISVKGSIIISVGLVYHSHNLQEKPRSPPKGATHYVAAHLHNEARLARHLVRCHGLKTICNNKRERELRCRTTRAKKIPCARSRRADWSAACQTSTNRAKSSFPPHPRSREAHLPLAGPWRDEMRRDEMKRREEKRRDEEKTKDTMR